MIFDRDLQAEVLRPSLHVPQNFDGIFDMAFNRDRARSVLRGPEKRSYDSRTREARSAHHSLQLLFRGALRGIECFRAGTDRPHTDLQLDPELFAIRPDLADMVIVQAAQEPDLRKMNDTGIQL